MECLRLPHRVSGDPGLSHFRGAGVFEFPSVPETWRADRPMGLASRPESLGRHAMLHEIRTLVVTGDAATAHPIRERLERRFPDMAVETTHTPSGLCLDYDVFVVDCPTVGTSVARMLRNENPQAFLLVFTDGLDGEALRELLTAACNAACDRVDDR